MNTSASTAEASDPIDAEAFAFVRELAESLSQATIELPSFPDVVVRIRRALQDDNVSTEMITRIVSAEPALATRILSMANSAAFNVSGKAVADLRTAIARLGFNMVRSAATTFIFEQLAKADALKGLEKPLDALWQRSVLVAAMCHTVAKQYTQQNPDAALLTGLLHGVGKLYILTRAARHPKLFADQAAFQSIVRDWHADITKALLETWRIDDDLVEAIHGYEDPERVGRGPLSLGDVLAVADVLASLRDKPDLLHVKIAESWSAGRLGLAVDNVEQVLQECNAEMNALKEALGH